MADLSRKTGLGPGFSGQDRIRKAGAHRVPGGTPAGGDAPAEFRRLSRRNVRPRAPYTSQLPYRCKKASRWLR